MTPPPIETFAVALVGDLTADGGWLVPATAAEDAVSNVRAAVPRTQEVPRDELMVWPADSYQQRFLLGGDFPDTWTALDNVEANIEIEITPPGPPDTKPWWTLFWTGRETTVHPAPGIEGDQPQDWGVYCTGQDRTDPWLAEGGTPYVIEQILDGFTAAGARARIVVVNGTPEARTQTLAALQAFADEHPQ